MNAAEGTLVEARVLTEVVDFLPLPTWPVDDLTVVEALPVDAPPKTRSPRS